MRLNRIILVSGICIIILLSYYHYKSCTHLHDSEITLLQKMMIEHITFSPKVIYGNGKVSKTLALDHPILIYRYSERMCDLCVEEDLFELRDLLSEAGKEYIYVLPNYSDTRSGRIRMANELEYFNYRNIPTDSLIIPEIEVSGGKRYFALINTDGNLESIFFPQSGYPEMTKKYFLSIIGQLEH